MIRWMRVRASVAGSGRTEGAGCGTGAPAARGAAATMSSTIRSAKTRPSRSEFEASRLAPWTPVQATSPHAYRPGTVVRPRRSVRTPPEA